VIDSKPLAIRRCSRVVSSINKSSYLLPTDQNKRSRQVRPILMTSCRPSLPRNLSWQAGHCDLWQINYLSNEHTAAAAADDDDDDNDEDNDDDSRNDEDDGVALIIIIALPWRWQTRVYKTSWNHHYKNYTCIISQANTRALQICHLVITGI